MDRRAAGGTHRAAIMPSMKTMTLFEQLSYPNHRDSSSMEVMARVRVARCDALLSAGGGEELHDEFSPIFLWKLDHTASSACF
jgi:hypothetical protein